MSIARASALMYVRVELHNAIARGIYVLGRVQEDEVRALTEMEIADLHERTKEITEAVRILSESYASLLENTSLS